MSAVEREPVEQYLVDRGNRPEMVAWKYFDESFNRGRERGYLWMANDEVLGFIGLIPFRLRCGSALRDTVWTCDWSLKDPQRSPGMGIKLLHKAATRHAMTLGGNELTRSILPRMAVREIQDAGVHLVVPLRLGHLLEKVDRRLQRVTVKAPRLTETRLAEIPMRTKPALRGGEVIVALGISERIGPLLACAAGPGLQPVYDLDYVQWQAGRCPDLEAWTCFAPAREGERVGAIVLKTRKAPSRWRMAWWMEPGGTGKAGAVLSTAMDLARKGGAAALSLLVARADLRQIALLRQHGFRERRGSEPLFLSGSEAVGMPPDRVYGLSYLDSDMAYIA